MNFLLRSSNQISSAAADASSIVDADKDVEALVHSSSFNSLQPLPAGDLGMGDELKGAGEFGSIWTRMPIEDHYDFPPDQGSILVPFRDFPENWASAPDMASLQFLDRDFIFPGIVMSLHLKRQPRLGTGADGYSHLDHRPHGSSEPPSLVLGTLCLDLLRQGLGVLLCWMEACDCWRVQYGVQSEDEYVYIGELKNWYGGTFSFGLKVLDISRHLITSGMSAGEQFHILVHVRTEDPPGPDIVTPFKVAAGMSTSVAKTAKQTSSGASNAVGDARVGGGPDDSEIATAEVSDGEVEGQVPESGGSKEGSSVNRSTGFVSSPTTLLQQEGCRKRSLLLLEKFKKSHYYVRIKGEDEPLGKKRVVGVHEPSISDTEGNGREEKNMDSFGCTPALMEGGKFDPYSAGGVARDAVDCSLLNNGDIAVLLQVSMAADSITDNAVLEVLQFERYEPPAFGPTVEGFGTERLKRGVWDPTPGLLQWLLPLDRPSSPPPSFVGSIHASPPKVALTATNSNIFSFGHLRSSSSGSMPAVQPQPTPVPLPTYAPPTYGSKEWDVALQERSTKAEVGSEGLLSFRGAVLEPQRFSAHFGLEGPHVPGKRWRRKLSIVQPIKLESYFAHCNAQDLICVLVENVLPPTGRTEEVIIYVDSVNIVCQSAAAGSPPLPVPVTCVEVGDDQQLPGLPLRVGEQHSFILRPTSPAWKPSPVNHIKGSPMGSAPGHELQVVDELPVSRRKHVKDSSQQLAAGGHYAVIVSCHCSHTESRLHYRHTLQWRPRVPRDLLVSVSLENSKPGDSSNEIQPVFKSQVVTVQATNLTSQDMNLTLLAPSSLANSPLSMVSFPAPLSDSPITQNYSEQHLRDPNEDQSDGSETEGEEASLTAQQLRSSDSASLPPVQSIESVIGISPILLREKNISAADMVAENSPARTHLWLQSTIPLGCVPAHSTTAVKCDILPLKDGIITLDTLHISTNEHDALYIPESPLQIYTTSSLATGVA